MRLGPYILGLGYTAVLEQEEEGGFVATLPALQGCVSQGDTQASALAHLKDALDGWIEVAQRHGLDIPPPDGLAQGVEFYERNLAMLRYILEAWGCDAEAEPLMEMNLGDGDVIGEYRAGRTRPLKDFIASLEICDDCRRW